MVEHNAHQRFKQCNRANLNVHCHFWSLCVWNLPCFFCWCKPLHFATLLAFGFLFYSSLPNLSLFPLFVTLLYSFKTISAKICLKRTVLYIFPYKSTKTFGYFAIFLSFAMTILWHTASFFNNNCEDGKQNQYPHCRNCSKSLAYARANFFIHFIVCTFHMCRKNTTNIVEIYLFTMSGMKEKNSNIYWSTRATKE